LGNLFGVYELLATSGLFDAEYYLRANPDIAQLNIDPLTHYLERGAVELRNPSDQFDAQHYVRQCRQRGESVDNPLLHYIEFGAAQGLTPRPQQAAAAGAADRPPLQLDVDSTEIDTTGILHVAGWAVCLAPIAAVQVFIDEQRLAAAEYGQPREDVAASHPDYPDSSRSGFRLRADVSAYGAGTRVIKVQALALSGVSREITLPLRFSGKWRASAPQRADAPLQHFCDRIEVTTGGRIAIIGWAVAPAATEDISVLLDGQHIGEAQTGIERPDVGNLFPTLAHARRAGFSFRNRLAEVTTGEHLVTLRHRAGGEETDIVLPVLALAVSATDAEPDTPSLAEDQDLLLNIDVPKLVDGALATPVRGNLEIAGWALARRGVGAIDIAIDGVRMQSATTGIRRPDVQRAHPDWDEALTAGFSALLPHRSLPRGGHSVSVALHDQAGKTAHTAFRIEVEDAPDTDGPWALRQRMTLAEIELQAGPLLGISERPSFALLLPLPRGARALELARTTLASLATQAYERWRLHVLTPTAQAASVRRALLHGFAELSDRIVLLSGAAAAGKVLTAGQHARYLMTLAPGDELGCDALLAFAIDAALHPEADFLYCDERRLSRCSGKVEPFFKPQWSPDLLLSMNYLGRAWCARADTFRRAAVRASGLAKLNGYDLALRLTEQARAIRHVPGLLFQDGDTAAPDQSLETVALQAALERRGIAAVVKPGRASGSYRVRRKLKTRGLVSIIIPTCGARGLIRRCIETVRAVTAYRNFEIVCVENIPAKDADGKAWLRAHADTVLETAEPFNWSRFNNLAVAASRGEFLLFLNDDIEIIDARWLHALLEQAERSEVGAVGPQLLYPDRRVQHAGMFLAGQGIARHAFRHAAEDDPGYFGLALTQRDIIAVTGACLMTRRETFETLGHFDETHDVVNNDVDYCLRAWRRGLRTIYTPHARLIHHELASRAAMDDSYDAVAFESSWRNLFAAGDPFFHPRLARDRDDYSVEWEPTEVVCSGHPVLSRDSIRRILVVKLDHIGDCITALPAIRRLKSHFPAARLTVLTSRASKAVWAMETAVDELIEFEFFHPRSEFGLVERTEQDWQELRARLAPHRFDLAIDLRKHPETRPVLRYSGARYLAGFDTRGRYPWLDVAIEWSEDVGLLRKRQHATDDLINLVDALVAAGESDRAVIRKLPDPLPAKALARIPDGRRIFDKRVVCVHPSVGNEIRQWPWEYFCVLIDQLIETEDVHVILTGSPDEAALGEKILERLANRKSAWSLMECNPLAEFPALIARCALFVGNNSGPLHIAAAVGIPAIGVHSGINDPREWGPLGLHACSIHRVMTCSPCYLTKLENCGRGLACLRGLLPGDVLPLCRQLLATAGSVAAAGHPPRQPLRVGRTPGRV
jgi:ADP-heptose:LPS heptosyltransferase/GT2 family glycosyltransferase